jgi:heptosyltransferase I
MPQRILPQRILIVRLSAIGDSILSVPVLNALRRNLPDAKIAWVTERSSSQLLQGHKALDDLIVVSKRAFHSASELWALRSQLREGKPDTTLDLQGLSKSSLIAWLSGAKSRFGFKQGPFDGRELSTWLNNRLIQPKSNHIVDRSLELLELIGITDRRVAFDLPEFEADTLFATQQLDELGLAGRFAIINVGAGWPSKIWPSDRYAEIAIHLRKRWGLPSLVVWSGDMESKTAQQVVMQSQGAAVLAPSTTLTQLRSLIRLAILFVGSDTGPMHLSVACGTPTVGMIGPMPIERVKPYGDDNIGIQNVRLSESRRSERKTNCAPMLSINVGAVASACDRIMEKQRTR